MQRSQDWASRIRGSVELQMVLACCLISNPHTWTSLILPDIPRSRPKQITALAEEGRYGDKRHELQETARNKRRRRKETRYHADRKVMSEHLKRADRFTTCRRGEIRKEQTTRHTSTRQQKLGVNLEISREPPFNDHPEGGRSVARDTTRKSRSFVFIDHCELLGL
ncbi:uncharacterized protein RAG0_03751 [Rhynchosporium agropyri]|uniref:Uncharacterized protein n=1 Tax=Rhynchosporium agropyri TaxID=914238 RepID=A0A1E1K646_9HELO|nr:uncharacterized protein RAG0_03751 [Rhynchosporium agropyri]